MPPNLPSISGLHHVTAITADAKKNIAFYRDVLGLRLVKLTVNFDDPSSYHLYYGDELGRPGTIMTFFAWPGAQRGRVGPPQVTATAFAVPSGSIDFWFKHLAEHGVALGPPTERFGQPILAFADPDGLPLEIIASSGAPVSIPASVIPSDCSIRAFHGITISQKDHASAGEFLADSMGFKPVASDQNRFRYVTPNSIVDLVPLPNERHGTLGAGTVHHVAYRIPNDVQQQAWHESLTQRGFNVSPIMERVYFRSIYFREPGKVLFEIATEAPGFTIDEPADQLGTKLMLPPWLEPHRAALEQNLPTRV